MTFEQVVPGTGAATAINSNFFALTQAGLYGRKDATTSGLTFGFYGGFFKSISIADGTVTLANNTTNYVVADAVTGAVSSSTASTNWDNTADYIRLHKIVTLSGVISSREDHRPMYSVGGVPAWSELTGIPAPITDIAALTDPGDDRLLMWDDSASAYVHATLGTNLSFSGTTLNASGGAGGGDVTGPASAVDERIAVFDGTTGDLIKDGGKTIAGLRAPAIQSVVSSATVTPTFLDDMVKITAQAAGLTLANPTGTAIDGLGMVIRIKDNGTARTIAYGSQYRAVGVTLPATTTINKTTYLAMVFNNEDTTWDVLAVGQES